MCVSVLPFLLTKQNGSECIKKTLNDIVNRIAGQGQFDKSKQGSFILTFC